MCSSATVRLEHVQDRAGLRVRERQKSRKFEGRLLRQHRREVRLDKAGGCTGANPFILSAADQLPQVLCGKV